MVYSGVENETTADRLEQVRVTVGESLNAWFERLKKREGFDMVYETVRRYHRDPEREASVKYLGVVSMEYGVSIEWLVHGTGPMWYTESREWLASFELIREKAGEFSRVAPAPVQATFHFTREKLVRFIPNWDQLTDEQHAEIGLAILEMAERPLRALSDQQAMSKDDALLYYQAAFQAIRLATPSQETEWSYEELISRLEGKNDG